MSRKKRKKREKQQTRAAEKAARKKVRVPYAPPPYAGAVPLEPVDGVRWRILACTKVRRCASN